MFCLIFLQINADVSPDIDGEILRSESNGLSEESHHLSTINYDTLDVLREELRTAEQPSAGLPSAELPTAVLPSAVLPSAELPSAVHPSAELPSAPISQEVGDELISTCVTPSRFKAIQETLAKPETHRHLCALNLLRHFFTKKELAESNTDGSHEKKHLDSNKLNSLKILVFSKFPVSTPEEKDKAWRLIKGKINSRCRTTRKLSLPDATPPRSS